jgi:adenylylsulfate kinase
MQYETRKRSILKAVSWRTLATITTAAIVFMFTGKVALALTVGFLEVFAKMALYFVHERVWQKLHFGKREVPAFVVWFTGLPASGKKQLADAVFKKLQGERLKVERLDSHDIRPLFPTLGFTPADVDRHIRRAGHLAAVLEKNGIIVIASFVSPYRESRDFARSLAKNFVEVYMRTTPEACEARDEHGHYRQARAGLLPNFPGVNSPYEEPLHPQIIIDVDHTSTEQAARQVSQYLKKKILVKS